MLAPLLVDLVPGTVGETLSKIVPSNAGEAMMSVTSRDSLSHRWWVWLSSAWVVGLLTSPPWPYAVGTARPRPKPLDVVLAVLCVPATIVGRASAARASTPSRSPSSS